MIFTTVKKRVEKEELFPNDAVMTLVDNKFSLNKKAMELFGFPMNVANTSRIANGFDENNNVILTNMDTKDMYTNNVTAKNDFSSQLLATRLSKQFKLDAILDNHFQLNLIEDDGTYKYAGVQLIHSVNVPFQSTNEPMQDLQEYPFIEFEEVVSDIIETAHADEITQQEEDIINSQSSCAEIVSDDTKEEPEGSEQVIPAEIVKRVINTESW
jgi:hypothetical protein